jgi:hypothetical protein
MKKTIYSLLVASVILMTSCSKDIEKVLVGTWNVDKFSASIVGMPFFSVEVLNDGTIEFKNNGKGTWKDKDGLVNNFSWISSNNKVTVDFEDEDTVVFDVLTNKKKEQVWESTNTVIDPSLGAITEKVRFEFSR